MIRSPLANALVWQRFDEARELVLSGEGDAAENWWFAVRMALAGLSDGFAGSEELLVGCLDALTAAGKTVPERIFEESNLAAMEFDPFIDDDDVAKSRYEKYSLTVDSIRFGSRLDGRMDLPTP